MFRFALAVVTALVVTPPAPAQVDEIKAKLDAEGRVELHSSGLVVEKADYRHDGKAVEAVLVHATAGGASPALLVIPGHDRSAIDALPIMVRFARAGFTVLSVSQPGYGKSEGPPDFVGPNTIAVLEQGVGLLAASPYADRHRLGVFGYSRGGLAAAILATRDARLKAAVVGGAIYDFASARDQVVEGIRANMDLEAGTSPEAIRARSPIRDVAAIAGPVLIIHGEDDTNAPLAQAKALDAALTRAGKRHQLVVVPAKGHALETSDIAETAVPFLRDALK
jgi:dipeptidyl aminopeptidase/acylaminoacyl peptidase